MNLQFKFKYKCKWCNSNQPQSCTVDNLNKNDNINKIAATAAATEEKKYLQQKRKMEWNEMKQIRVK